METDLESSCRHAFPRRMANFEKVSNALQGRESLSWDQIVEKRRVWCDAFCVFMTYTCIRCSLFCSIVYPIASSSPDPLYGLCEANIIRFEFVESHSHHNSGQS
jgi:hypothetical protein